MAIDFSEFYGRIGKLADMCIDANAYRGTDLPADIVAIAGAYTYDPDLLDGLYAQQDSQQSSVSQVLSYMRTLAIATLYDTVDDDRPLVNKSLASYLTELNQQQVDQSIELDDSPATIGTITANANNVGDAVVVMSSKNTSGVVLDSVLPEDLRIDCLTDEARGATKWQEIISITGEELVTDKLSWEWPGGSGTSFTMTLRDPAIDGIVLNAALNAYATLDAPDNWTVVAGTESTDFEEFDTTLPRADSVECLRLIPTSTDVELTQAVTLQPNSRYIVSIKAYVNAGSATPDPIYVQLYDSENGSTDGNVIADDAGTANTLTVTPVENQYTAESVTATNATNVINLTAHTVASGDAVVFGGTAVPGGLTDGVTYYARDITANTFKVAATRGGTAIDLSSDGTAVTLTKAETWKMFTGVFITPATLPDGGVWLSINTNQGGDLLIAQVHMSLMAEMYPGGPAISAVSGVRASSAVDRYTSAITLSGANDSMVRWMERFYNVSNYGISLRTSNSPTSGFDDASLIGA